MPISHSPALPLLSTLFATILLSFGLNAIFRPLSALSFFELYPSTSLSPSSHENTLITALLTIYGIRDIFMSFAIYTAAYYSRSSAAHDGRKVLGLLVLAGGGVAFADGAVCKFIVGKGEWGHWGYAPVMGVVGLLLCGVLG